MLEKVERSVLFPIVRNAVFVVAFFLLLAMLGGLIFVAAFNGIKKDKIEILFSDVQAVIQPEEVNEEIVLPKNTEKYIAEYYSIGILDSADWIIRDMDSEGRGWRELFGTPQKVIEAYVAGDLSKEQFGGILVNWANQTEARLLFETSEEADAYLTNFSKIEDILVIWKANWRNSFKTVEDLNNYLENMSKIVAEAERRDPENVLQYVNRYRDLFYDEQNTREDVLGLGEILGDEGAARIAAFGASIEERINQFITSVVKTVVVFGILFLFVLFTIMVALLSLLSIERNTRSRAAGQLEPEGNTGPRTDE